MHASIRSAVIGLSVCAAAWALPAFPGAEGWGTETPGGRGPDPKAQPPKVYVVTTLAMDGKGSFNEALQATGPRIIVFRVSGVIDLQTNGTLNHFRLASEHGYVTIAGQTSPGGITLKNSGIGAGIFFSYHGDFHDGIFRFLRFRAGDGNNDGVTMNTTRNFVFDHCDFSGGSDETLDISASKDFTLQWCTIANSSVCPDCQTYGFLMGYSPTSHISLHHNLMAHHVHRFPAMHWDKTAAPDNGKIDYRNNVLYNGGDYFMLSGNIDPPKTVQMNIVGNTFKGGPQSPPNATNEAAWFFSMVSLGDEITGYEKDNIMIPRVGQPSTSRVTERTPNRVLTPWTMPAVTTQSASDAYNLVLDKVGAWPRDAMNARTVAEVRNGTGQFGKDDDPLITTGPPAPVDLDNDGMPDVWETAMGLNPLLASDNVADQDNDGYLNIEEFINDLASVRMGDVVQNVKALDQLRALYSVGVKEEAGKPAAPMRATQDRRRGQLQIQLPGGSRAEGRIEIADSRGRRVASLPARPVTEWDYDGSLPRGVYTAMWVVAGSRVSSVKVDIL